MRFSWMRCCSAADWAADAEDCALDDCRKFRECVLVRYAMMMAESANAFPSTTPKNPHVLIDANDAR